MRFLLAVFVSFFLALPAGLTAPTKPFLAVFCNPGFQSEWDKYNPDYLFVARDWNDFEPFVQEVKRQAGSRDIELDVDVHGEDYGLYLEYRALHQGSFQRVSYRSTVGYMVKSIDRYLSGNHPVVYLEACYSGRAYKNTIRRNPVFKGDGDISDNYRTIPRFPIYGVGSRTINYGNFIYLQKYYNTRVFFEDLRKYERMPLDTKETDMRSAINQVLRMSWVTLKMMSF